MKDLLDFVCRTDTLLYMGVIMVMIFVATKKCQSKPVEFLDVSTIFISVMSLVAGFKLFVNNLSSAEYTTDAIFTAYGGLSIIWMTTRNMYKKFKS